jgi:plasmid stabilization system protein ParE
MSAYIVAPKADEDVFDIWRYLYDRAGVEVANRIEAELYDMFEKLAQNPGSQPQRARGHRRII